MKVLQKHIDLNFYSSDLILRSLDLVLLKKSVGNRVGMAPISVDSKLVSDQKGDLS